MVATQKRRSLTREIAGCHVGLNKSTVILALAYQFSNAPGCTTGLDACRDLIDNAVDPHNINARHDGSNEFCRKAGEHRTMAPDVEALCRPVSAEAPCGADLEDTQLLAGFDAYRLFGSDIPLGANIDWREIRDKSLEALATSHDLRLLAHL